MNRRTFLQSSTAFFAALAGAGPKLLEGRAPILFRRGNAQGKTFPGTRADWFPEPSPATVEWVGYHLTTESYDRSLPGRWSSRDPRLWLPAPRARRQSSGNAVVALGHVSPAARRDKAAARTALDFVGRHYLRGGSALPVYTEAVRRFGGPRLSGITVQEII